MQELVLIDPDRTLSCSPTREAERLRAEKEFTDRLVESGPLAFRVALGVLRNRADAEDVAQETLLRALSKRDTLRDPCRIRGWMVRIAFRLALDRTRAARRRERRESDWAVPEHRPVCWREEVFLTSKEFRSRFERAMQKLPEKLRLVLLLSAIEGYTVEEVSDILAVPPGTVKSRMSSARKKLAEELR